MNRRTFLSNVGSGMLAARLASAETASADIDITEAAVIVASNAGVRERKAATVLVDEVAKRSQLRWLIDSTRRNQRDVAIYVGTSGSAKNAGARLPPEGFAIRSGSDTSGPYIAITGGSDRGLMFGVGELLRAASFSHRQARVPLRRVNIESAPIFRLRGHQLGYRPKTNAYDAWDVARWDQYIRDLAMFGTNAIELLPPRTDDAAESPHFPVRPEQMMIEMSRICDEYGLDVWIWYPALERDYTDSVTVEAALKEWARVFESLPRVDAVFVPGGDPGHTEPKVMFAFLEKQKAHLRRFHPTAQMWMSPQSFDESWMTEFIELLDRTDTARLLDGIVHGPQCRIGVAELRKRVPLRYPIRVYPDITHSLACQFPAPEWDVAFAITEGRECINPRPVEQTNIFRKYCPDSIGFITYSEGCNDDVNKFVWTLLGWNPQLPPIDALREFSRYFFGDPSTESLAQGLLALENNWRGPLSGNASIAVTLAQFQDIERAAPPALFRNWRFEQALYRAYFDASLHSRAASESEAVARAYDVLSRVDEIGWEFAPLDIGASDSDGPANGLEPDVLLDQASSVLGSALLNPVGARLRARVRELGEALFQSIGMQLAVKRYRAEAVSRGANLETLETPITDIAWLRAQIATMRKLRSAKGQIVAIRTLLRRTDPGPGGFYDDLGNPSHRPHLVPGPGGASDPEFRNSALTGYSYPDSFGDTAPRAWKCWAESLYDAALTMQYPDLDPTASYLIRIVYSGDAKGMRIRLVANDLYEVHPFLLRPWPPQPVEFDLPRQATAGGAMKLSWTREQGLGGNGRGCQVSEVWIVRK